jgi:hypothetical protein
MSIRNRLRLIKGVLPKIMKTHQSKNGRIFLLKKENKWIFKQLQKLGCFNFFCNNKGHILGLSQIISFLDYGWKALANGFTAPSDEIEVHHINSDVTDNSPENLVFLSVQDHQFVSNVTFTPFYGKVKYEASTPFNRQGLPTSNRYHFLINIIQETVAAVSTFRSSKTVNVPYYKVLLSLPSSLWKKATNYINLPKWIDHLIFQHLCPSPFITYTQYATP